MAQKVAVSREFEARLRHAATGKLSLSTSERRGMGSAFHQLCPRYSGTLTPTAPTAIRLWDTFTFFLCLAYPQAGSTKTINVMRA